MIKNKQILTTALFNIGLISSLFAQVQSEVPQATTSGSMSTEVIVLMFALIIVISIFLWYSNVNLWLRAMASNVKIALHELALIRYKDVPPEFIVNIQIKAKEAGLDLDQKNLVAIFLAEEEGVAKSTVEKVANIMIKAHNAGLELKLDHVIKHVLAKVEVEKIVDVLILAHNSHISIELNKLVEFYLAGINVKELVENYIKAHSAHLISTTIQELSHLHHAHVNISQLVSAMIIAKEGGLIYGVNKSYKELSEKEKDEIKKSEKSFQQKLVEHYHSGGKILNVVNAVVSAKNADMELEDNTRKLELNFEAAANIDLAGINIEEAVKDAIQFKVVQTDPISAYAADGIQLTMRCKVTIRPRIRKIIKGAGEETILARINEGIVSQIGLTPTHRIILENPYKLADEVEKKTALFEDTAYDVISIDISDIQVGKDIEAELKTLRAKANYEEERVRHLMIEAEVQKAMADAFRDGTFSIKDYHKLKNMEADTIMREAISKNPPKDSDIAI